MSRAGVSILVGLACALGAATRPAASQQPQSWRDSLFVTVQRMRPSPGPQITCPMPVQRLDASAVERMPVAPTDARGHFIQVVPPGCVNPLFRGPLAVRSQRSLEPAPGSPHSFPRLWPPILHRDSLPALRFPFPGADPIPGVRLPLHPPQP